MYRVSCFIILLAVIAIQCDETLAPRKHNITSATRFLIYDVNPGEGFNLRRDVYIRVANLVNHMVQKGEDWVIVLPPWLGLYHWQSRYQRPEPLPWTTFFDITNMETYVPVMDLEDFVKLKQYNGIDHLLYLQMHPNTFKNNGEWKEEIEFAKCKDTLYHRGEDGHYHGYFWDIPNVFAKKYDCVDVHGLATVLADFLKKLDAKSVFIQRFEQVLHIDFGSVDFFKARRSLVFAKHLRTEADLFRQKYLNSTDDADKTPYNEDWRLQVPGEDESAIGGPYIGLHMRRGDFTYAHQETVPTIKEIGDEVDKVAKKYGVGAVYVSTDGTAKEVKLLQSYLSVKILQFPRPKDVVKKFHDGGIAVIDQWIAAHARYFIGTCESTFSFRIQEERDILGFNPDTTYNCICGKQSPPDTCEQPSRWRVTFS